MELECLVVGDEGVILAVYDEERAFHVFDDLQILEPLPNDILRPVSNIIPHYGS